MIGHLLFFGSGLLLLGLTRPALGQDWPQFLGPTRNGVYSGTNIAKAWPADGPPVRWQHKVGEGFSGPVVVGTKLILFHRVADKETVECLDTEKGGTLWSNSYPTHYRDDFGFDEGPRATPAIDDGRVYTLGAEGVLNCWNLADGKRLWTVDTKKEYGTQKGFFGIACSPLVESNLVLLNIGGRDGAGIVAFDQQSGKLRWKATDQQASYSSPTTADIHGKHYAFFLTRDGLVMLSPASGQVAAEFPWRPPINASVSAATPLAIDDYIFLSISYGRGAVLATTSFPIITPPAFITTDTFTVLMAGRRRAVTCVASNSRPARSNGPRSDLAPAQSLSSTTTSSF